MVAIGVVLLMGICAWLAVSAIAKLYYSMQMMDWMEWCIVILSSAFLYMLMMSIIAIMR